MIDFWCQIKILLLNKIKNLMQKLFKILGFSRISCFVATLLKTQLKKRNKTFCKNKLFRHPNRRWRSTRLWRHCEAFSSWRPKCRRSPRFSAATNWRFFHLARRRRWLWRDTWKGWVWPWCCRSFPGRQLRRWLAWEFIYKQNQKT